MRGAGRSRIPEPSLFFPAPTQCRTRVANTDGTCVCRHTPRCVASGTRPSPPRPPPSPSSRSLSAVSCPSAFTTQHESGGRVG
eukprot:9302218-Pyramimonas_sp.AAC.1